MARQQGRQQGIYTFLTETKDVPMPRAYNPTTADGRSVADNNEIEVLKSIRYFGHLRRTEVARAVWPRSSHRSAYLMAQRTVKRMLEKGLLLERANSLGSISLILASKGVARLRELNITAVEGYDMTGIGGPQFFHRTIGNCFLIDRARNGEVVYGEYALSRDWAPLTRAMFRDHYKKIPDGVTVTSGSVRGYAEGFQALDWIEVESSYKPDDELRRLFELGLRLPEPVQSRANLVLDQIVFVYDTRQGYEERILRALRAYIRDHPEANDPQRLSHIVLARAHIDLPFLWHGVLEHTAWDLLNGVTEDAVAAFEPTEMGPPDGPVVKHQADTETVPELGPEQETPSSWGVLRPKGSGRVAKKN
jgi:hypothetical protein